MSMATVPTTGQRWPPTRASPLLESPRENPSAYPMGTVATRVLRLARYVAP